MDGSGRVSLRNGQYLRRIVPVSSVVARSNVADPGVVSDRVTCEMEEEVSGGNSLRRSARLRGEAALHMVAASSSMGSELCQGPGVPTGLVKGLVYPPETSSFSYI